MKFFRGIVVVVAVFCFFSCKNGKQEIEQLQQRIDSLEKVDTERKNDMKDLTGFITTLSDGLDSIAAQEDMLFTNKGVEGVYVDRKQLKLNLEMFEERLIQQKLRINQFRDSLKAKGAKIEMLNGLVKHLNQQIDEKNQQIQVLKAELQKKNVDIVQLRSKVSSLTESNAQLSETVQGQAQALIAQDEIINEGYVKIGTKKELKNSGLIKGGFFKKKKVDYSNLRKEQFSVVDIRSCRTIPVKAKSIKVWSPMPESSYKIEKKDDGTTSLHIIDPTAFWSVTNFLIIQAN